MKLINKTKYDTRTVRSILAAVHVAGAAVRVGNRNARHDGKLRTWKSLTITLTYNSTHWGRQYSGYAYFHGHESTLRVPKGKLDVEKFAALWQHELAHLYGIRHKDMGPAIMRCKTGEWTKPFVARFGQHLEEEGLHEAPKAPEVEATERKSAKLDELQKKLARIDAREKAWATKAKRAANALKKVAKERKALKRRLAKTEERPVEDFKKAARAPRKPEPKPPHGFVRLKARLTRGVASELDYLASEACEWEGVVDHAARQTLLEACGTVHGKGKTLNVVCALVEADWFIDLLTTSAAPSLNTLSNKLWEQRYKQYDC
jgi:hypothetical protein